MYKFELIPSFNCQYNCSYCYNKEANYFGIQKEYNMLISDYDKLFSNINLIDSYDLLVSGGEPLYYSYICELMQYIKIHSKAKTIKIITNFKNCDVIFNNLNLFIGYNYNYTISYHTEFIDDINLFVNNVVKFKSLIHKNSKILILMLITNDDNINYNTIKALDKIKGYVDNIKIKPINNLDTTMIKKYRHYLLDYDEYNKPNYNICNNINRFKEMYCTPNNMLGIFPNGNIKSSCYGLIKEENFITKEYNCISIHNLMDKLIKCGYETCWSPDCQLIKKWSNI